MSKLFLHVKKIEYFASYFQVVIWSALEKSPHKSLEEVARVAK